MYAPPLRGAVASWLIIAFTHLFFWKSLSDAKSPTTCSNLRTCSVPFWHKTLCASSAACDYPRASAPGVARYRTTSTSTRVIPAVFGHLQRKTPLIFPFLGRNVYFPVGSRGGENDISEVRQPTQADGLLSAAARRNVTRVHSRGIVAELAIQSCGIGMHITIVVETVKPSKMSLCQKKNNAMATQVVCFRRR